MEYNFTPGVNNNIYLENYKQRSIFDSNCIEYWAEVSDIIVPGRYPDRYYISSFGRTYNKNTGKPFGTSMHRKGYLQYNFATIDHKGVTRKLHRVIMYTFCYFPGCEKYEINHKDGNKLNNCLTNLEWCTHSENTIHAINMGLKTVFGNEVNVVLSDNDVQKIMYLYEYEDMTPSMIIDTLNIPGLTKVLVEQICHGRSRRAYFNDLYGERSSTSGNTYSFVDIDGNIVQGSGIPPSKS